MKICLENFDKIKTMEGQGDLVCSSPWSRKELDTN